MSKPGGGWEDDTNEQNNEQAEAAQRASEAADEQYNQDFKDPAKDDLIDDDDDFYEAGHVGQPGANADDPSIIGIGKRGFNPSATGANLKLSPGEADILKHRNDFRAYMGRGTRPEDDPDLFRKTRFVPRKNSATGTPIAIEYDGVLIYRIDERGKPFRYSRYNRKETDKRNEFNTRYQKAKENYKKSDQFVAEGKCGILLPRFEAKDVCKTAVCDALFKARNRVDKVLLDREIQTDIPPKTQTKQPNLTINEQEHKDVKQKRQPNLTINEQKKEDIEGDTERNKSNN